MRIQHRTILFATSTLKRAYYAPCSRSQAALLACLILLLSIVSGCVEHCPVTPYSERSRMIPGEGSVFVYEEITFSDEIEVRRDTFQLELISRTATIGGRENLVAFESSINRQVTYWDHDENDDLWKFYPSFDSVGPIASGVWARFPTSGSGVAVSVLLDTTLTNGGSLIRRFRNMQTCSPAGTGTYEVDRRPFGTRKLSMLYESEIWENGNLKDRSYSYTLDESYILELGVLAKSFSRLDSGTSSSIKTLISIALK